MKTPNGTIPKASPSLVGLGPLPTTTPWHTLLGIVRSAVPYLAFLMMYGMNNKVPIFARFQDIDCVHLYNVSAFEYKILHFLPHEFISAHSAPILDILAAVPYLMHYILPVIFPLFLFLTNRVDYIPKFYWLLGWAMWAHFMIWFFLPTGPPWFYDNLELYARQNLTRMPPIAEQHKEGCAFRRLDERSGIRFFFNMFGGNPVPFASFPSGHVAWPTAIYLTHAPGGRPFALYILWVAWATLYSCHHYISDAIVAILLVTLTRKALVWLGERSSRTRDTSRNNGVCPLNMV